MGRQVDQMRRNIQNSQDVHWLCFHFMTHMNSLRFLLMGILLEKLSVSQTVNIAFRNPDVHYRAHKNRPLLPVRNKIAEVLTSHPVSEMYSFNIILPSTSMWFSTCPLLFRRSGQNMCASPLYRLYIIILTQFGKEYKLRSPVRIQWRLCKMVVTPLIIFWLALLGSIFQNIER